MVPIKLFIGIPFYNNEETLEHAILSVLNQNYTNWRLILLDDGSRDLSKSIAEKYVSEQVSVVSDGENRGLVDRLNQLINLADEEIFVRMDADDIMHPDRLLKQIRYLQENPAVDVIGTNAYVIDEKNQVISLRKGSSKNRTLFDVVKFGMFIHPSVMGRTKWFRENKYCSKFTRAEDLELWCRTFNSSQFHIIEESLIFYRDPLKFSWGKYYKTHKSIIKIIKKFINDRNKKVSLILREKLKINVYGFLSLFSLSDLIHQRRNPDIEASLKEAAGKELNKAISLWK